ncbi:unnamed protein product [Parnassius mnemosyne]|uniref:Peptidase metallopeptidase domain-containing protein n=1 Tax=Parnassius mnemosyne TaxID=213953 RepID=A0AAV1KBX1_9NEOP
MGASKHNVGFVARTYLQITVSRRHTGRVVKGGRRVESSGVASVDYHGSFADRRARYKNFNSMRSVIAHAFCPEMGGAIHFDDTEVWSAKMQSNRQPELETTNLYVTALHEFGHSLGLSHDYNRWSIMYPYYRDIEFLPANWKHWARQDVELLYKAIAPPTNPNRVKAALTFCHHSPPPTIQTTHEPELSISIFDIISLTPTKRDQRMATVAAATTTNKDGLCADYDSVVGRLMDN